MLINPILVFEALDDLWSQGGGSVVVCKRLDLLALFLGDPLGPHHGAGAWSCMLSEDCEQLDHELKTPQQRRHDSAEIQHGSWEASGGCWVHIFYNSCYIPKLGKTPAVHARGEQQCSRARKADQCHSYPSMRSVLAVFAHVPRCHEGGPLAVSGGW